MPLAVLGGMVLHVFSSRIVLFITDIAIIIESLFFALAPINALLVCVPTLTLFHGTDSHRYCQQSQSTFSSMSRTSTSESSYPVAGKAWQALQQRYSATRYRVDAGIGRDHCHRNSRSRAEESYQSVFWFNLTCGATALVVFMAFVRISRAKSDLIADEKEESEKAGAAEQ